MISPNPVTDKSFDVYVPNKGNEQVRLQIINTLGRVVEEVYISGNEKAAIKVSAPGGLYIIHAITTERIFTSKIVVKE